MGYRNLEVWQKGRELVVQVYRCTSNFPQSEMFGLTSQMRRAAVSIPANVAEGYGRRLPGSYSHFLRIAKGSLNELETLVVVSLDLGYLSQPEGDELLAACGKLGSMTTNLIAKVSPGEVREEVASYGS